MIDSGMSSAGAMHLDRVQHQIDRAALLHARRGFAIDDVHGDADAHARTRRKPQEIDMNRPVGDDVELIVARQHPLLAPADFEFENRGQEVAGIDELVDSLKSTEIGSGFSPPP